MQRKVNLLSFYAQDEITFNICAKNLDKKDIIGLSDPFLAFYRVHENGR